MIDPEKRKAIYLLHQEGMSVRQIARRLGVARNSVREIIALEGKTPQTPRKDKQQIDPELLRALHNECEGRVQRVHEKLAEEQGIEVKYSTLTRMLRELGISQPQKTRCHRVPDEPGAEMQHDTTVYQLQLGTQRVKVIASLLYLRYSKRRYLKFYRTFNRFKMKCFLHEGLMFWGCTAPLCIIDNTNLARLRGTGANAVMTQEMAAFGREHGFEFICHEKGHANRKAGEERSFWTVETNFLPGRSFTSMEDLNGQAYEWATGRMDNRPQTKANLIPAKAFEHERAFLIELPAHLPAPYRQHQRDTDQYGFISFDANFYWVPGTDRNEVIVLEHADRIKIYRLRECLAEYPLPPDGTRNQWFSPDGLPKPPHRPRNRKAPTQEEEKRLRALGPAVGAYLDWIAQIKGLGRHRFLRSLLALSRKMTPELFIKTVERAAKYRIEDIHTVERIAILLLQQPGESLPLVSVDEEFTQREAYQEGSLTETPDLSDYDQPEEDNSTDSSP